MDQNDYASLLSDATERRDELAAEPEKNPYVDILQKDDEEQNDQDQDDKKQDDQKNNDQQKENKKNDDDKKPLTLKGLSGAFIILGSGYSIAIAVFIVELVHHHHKKQAVIKNQPAADDVVPTSVDAAVISHDERKHVVTLIAAAFVLVDIESDSDDNEKRSPMDTIIAAVDVHS